MSKTEFKAFKRLSAATEAAQGLPIVRVGNLYLAPVKGDIVGMRITSVDLIEPVAGTITGTITLRHLDRLGNGNWAEAHPSQALSNVIQPHAYAFDVNTKQTEEEN